MIRSAAAAAIIAFLIIMGGAHAQHSFGPGSGPVLHLITNKASYDSGESGFVVLMMDTYGVIDKADIEVEMLSDDGRLVGGDVMSTEIPESSGEDEPYQTVQTIYQESVTYFGPERKVYRTVEFDVPLDARTGNYTILGRVVSPEATLTEKVGIHVTGPGGFTDVIFLAYIAVLGFSFYLIRRG